MEVPITKIPFGVDISYYDSTPESFPKKPDDMPYAPTPDPTGEMRYEDVNFPWQEVIIALMNMLGEKTVRLDAVDLQLVGAMAQHNKIQLTRTYHPNQLLIEVVPK